MPEPDLSGVFTLHHMDRYQVGSWSPLVHSAGVMCFHATGRWYSEKIEHPSWPINKYYLNTILIFPLLKKKKKENPLDVYYLTSHEKVLNHADIFYSVMDQNWNADNSEAFLKGW